MLARSKQIEKTLSIHVLFYCLLKNCHWVIKEDLWLVSEFPVPMTRKTPATKKNLLALWPCLKALNPSKSQHLHLYNGNVLERPNKRWIKMTAKAMVSKMAPIDSYFLVFLATSPTQGQGLACDKCSRGGGMPFLRLGHKSSIFVMLILCLFVCHSVCLSP